MTRPRPVSPALEFQRKQAKALLKAHAAADAQALARFQQHHPRLAGLAPDSLRGLPLRLADAQLVLAREQGFESWPRFVKHLQSASAADTQTAVWKAAERAVIAADAEALGQLLHDHARQFREQQPPAYGSGGLTPNYALADARAIIAREHYFANWDDVAAYLHALRQPESPVARFEAAVEAIVTGDTAALRRLLRTHPDLLRARSTRTHHSTLLHYVGANGVESFHQKTPQNAVEIAELLLEAGADVDAPADMYGGGSTTLGLVATSIHPAQAGVQEALIDTLLRHGASLEAPGSAGNGHSAVDGCLANGRGAAAEHLARRGAWLGLEGAAGVGALEVVRGFFTPDGALQGGATEAQLKSGFNWACQYGRTPVVEFLLRQQGLKLDELHRGATGLHWAAYSGNPDVVRVLLAQGAPLDLKDESFDGTPLDWALHGWLHPPLHARPERYYEVVALLSAASPAPEPGPTLEAARADPRMLVALGGDEAF